MINLNPSWSEVWRSVKVATKYTFGFLALRIITHWLKYVLFGSTHPGLFDEFFWTTDGCWWGIFLYDLWRND